MSEPRIGDQKRADYKLVMVVGGDGYIGENLKLYLKNKKETSIFSYDSKRGSRGEQFDNVQGFDAIVLLAAFPGVIPCRGNFKKAVTDNISVAFNIMKLAAPKKIPVIFTSSQAAKAPFDNFYATIKKIIEVEALRLNALGADNRILRLTNVYGGKDYLELKNTVVKQFIAARSNDVAMMVNGDGSQIRDFIHVNDVCRAIFKCIMHPARDKRIREEPIDIGTGQGLSIAGLARMLGTKYVTVPDSDTVGADSSVAKVTAAKQILGFETQHHLIEYIKSHQVVMQTKKVTLKSK